MLSWNAFFVGDALPDIFDRFSCAPLRVGDVPPDMLSNVPLLVGVEPPDMPSNVPLLVGEILPTPLSMPFLGGDVPPAIVSNTCAKLPTSLFPRLCSGAGRGELHVLERAERRDDAVESEARE